MNDNGHLIVIVAPSGTGKSTLISRLKEEFSFIVESVSFTTREKRTGELDGVHYHFISIEEFEKRKADKEFLEWAKVHSNYYGTSKHYVTKCLEANKVLLLDLDVQGADSFKNYFKEKANIIFIEPPSVEELEKRLLTRGTESKEVIAERIKNAKKELTRKNDFDYSVMNKNIDQAYIDLKKVVMTILGDSHVG